MVWLPFDRAALRYGSNGNSHHPGRPHGGSVGRTPRPAEEPTHRWWGRRGSDGSSWSSWSLCPHLGLVCGGGGLMASRCDSQCIGMLVGAMGDGGAKFTIKL